MADFPTLWIHASPITAAVEATTSHQFSLLAIIISGRKPKIKDVDEGECE
jgi:hypothetical protein